MKEAVEESRKQHKSLKVIVHDPQLPNSFFLHTELKRSVRNFSRVRFDLQAIRYYAIAIAIASGHFSQIFIDIRE